MIFSFIVYLSIILNSSVGFAGTVADLESAARKEGSLNVFSNGLAYGDILVKAFEEKYPELKIKRTAFEAAGPRYFMHNMMESEKESARADVVFRCQDRDLPEWVENDWLAELDELPDWAQHAKRIEDDKRYVYFLGAPHVVFYNPAKIKESDLPKSYDEILDPKWKGKLAMRSPLRGNAGAFFVHFIQSTRVDLSWYEKFGNNKPFIGQSGYSVHEAVESGKALVGLSRDVEVISFANDYKKKTGRTSQLKYKILENESPYQYQLFLVNKGAPHSAAAKLFANWLLSSEATAVLEKAGFSVGERQKTQFAHKNLWQWELNKVKRFFRYESDLATAYRKLKTGGAQFESESKQHFVMAGD